MRRNRLWPLILATSQAACVHGSFGVGVGGGTHVAGGGEVSFPSGSPKPLGSPKRDAGDGAENLAKQFWPTMVVQCGDSHFAIVYVEDAGLRLTEFRGATFTVEADELTEADKEQRIEWKGHTSMHAAAKRWRRPDGTWSDWASAGEVAKAPLQLVGMQWNMREPRAALMNAGFATAPDCSMLKKSPGSLDDP